MGIRWMRPPTPLVTAQKHALVGLLATSSMACGEHAQMTGAPSGGPLATEMAPDSESRPTGNKTGADAGRSLMPESSAPLSGADTLRPSPREDVFDCVEFRAHGKPAPGDETPFEVPVGERYQCFYFNGPWKGPVQAGRIDSLLDNSRVLHHMVLYNLGVDHAEGEIEACLGTHADGRLIPTVGLDNLPPDVGIAMDAGADASFLLELHYVNFLEEGAVPDRTGLRVCVYREPRPRSASVSWLGTEVIGIPPNSAATATGMCHPLRTGIDADQNLELYAVIPHMHQYGRRAEMLIHRSDGSVETVLDKPFSYANPVDYPVAISVAPGEYLETRCHFQNPEADWVFYGPSLFDEMCYFYTLAYPAAALDNPGLSFVGGPNTCFW